LNTDQSNETPLPLDGNAAGGLLRDLFAFDVTAASITCDGCGTVALIAEAKLYGVPMGAIIRCAHCDAAVMRLVRTPAGFWLDMRGARRVLARPIP
jgi:hypothetical protein